MFSDLNTHFFFSEQIGDKDITVCFLAIDNFPYIHISLYR